MDKAFKTVLFAFVLFLQFLFVLPRAGNLAHEPYRRTERAAALNAVADNPTPATQAAFQEELQRAMSYTTRRDLARSGLTLAGFLLIDGFVIWWFRKGRKGDQLTPNSGGI